MLLRPCLLFASKGSQKSTVTALSDLRRRRDLGTVYVLRNPAKSTTNSYHPSNFWSVPKYVDVPREMQGTSLCLDPNRPVD